MLALFGHLAVFSTNFVADLCMCICYDFQVLTTIVVIFPQCQLSSLFKNNN